MWNETWRLFTLKMFGFLMVLLVAMSATSVPAQPAEERPTAEKPTFNVGNRWEYTDRGIVRVVKLETGTILVEENGIQRYYTDEWNPTEDFSPFLPLLNFPLYVGKKWAMRTQNIGYRPRLWSTEVEVVAHEQIEVAGSKHWAFRLEIFRRGTSLLFFEYWYAPACGCIAKSQPKPENTSPHYTRGTFSLINYSVQKQ